MIEAENIQYVPLQFSEGENEVSDRLVRSII